MATAEVEYLGNLRTKCRHIKSGAEIITDAPVDNHGKGEAFSPTDLFATAYLSCILTIMGIYCDKNGIEFKSGKGSLSKVMGAGPRRISELNLEIDLSGNDWSEEERKAIINAGENCPVAKNVSDVVVNISYRF